MSTDKDKDKPEDKTLQGVKVFFAEGHLDAISVTALIAAVKAHTGEVVSSAEDATAILINPNSPQHRPITGSQASASASTPRLPYHWIAQSATARRALPASELSPATPWLQHDEPMRRGRPVRIYVSKNVHRGTDAGALQTWRVVGADLASAGAVIVPKRADADVLVVDRRSDFFVKTIKPEIVTHKRAHQLVGERSWVDTCLAEKRFAKEGLQAETGSGAGIGTGVKPPSPNMEGAGASAGASASTASAQPPAPTPKPATPAKAAPTSPAVTKPASTAVDSAPKSPESAAREQREDSFAADDEPAFKRAGRPAGRGRTEYSPEDDDFLCRYLAAFYPGGAWGSRKTYGLMVERTKDFPIVERHTQQSWHERFKKNAAPFERRLRRFIEEGIDNDLQTADERKRKAERKAARRAAAAEKAATEHEKEVATRPAKDKGKGRAEPAPESASAAAPASSPSATKRKLVSLLSDDEESEADKRSDGHRRVANQPIGRTARIEALGPSPEIIPGRAAPESGHAPEPAAGPAPAADADVEMQDATAAAPPNTIFALDDNVLPQAAVVTRTVEMTIVETAEGEAVLTEAVTTAAIVEAPSVPSAASSEPSRAPTPREATPKPADPQVPLTPAPPGRAATPQSAPAPVATPLLPSRRRTPRTAPRTAPPHMATPEPQPENNQRLHETPGTSSAPSTQRTRGQTPPSPDVGPARRALEREIQSAASHRRSSSSGTRTLATVSQNTVAQRAPPPKERDAAAVAASYAAVYPEPLSAEQRAARAAQGAQGAQAVADVQAEYRRRVSLYTVKYNVRPAELMRIVQDATRGSNVDYWGRVDGVLREKYGF